MLREESAAADAKRFNHKYGLDTFVTRLPDAHAIHVHGDTGLGKTKLAVATIGPNVCFIKPFDSVGCLEMLVKMYDPAIHDGLVLDEADLSFMSRQLAIAFLDPDEPCTIDVRYKSHVIPPVRKILVSNPHPYHLYPHFQNAFDPAIARRLTVYHVDRPTYAAAAGPPTVAPIVAPLPPPAAPRPTAPSPLVLPATATPQQQPTIRPQPTQPTQPTQLTQPTQPPMPVATPAAAAVAPRVLNYTPGGMQLAYQLGGSP